MQSEHDNQEKTKVSSSGGTQLTPAQVALENLRRLTEAAERFSKEVRDGTIAPPTSAGRWK